MRYISQNEIVAKIKEYELKLRVEGKLPEGKCFLDLWEEKARAALEDVRNAPDDQKTKRINAHSDIWADIKDLLSFISDGKCWYCESVQNRSDNPVDHFRPKNSVYGCPNHKGYWWLAFKLDNYRFSCTFCNSRRRDKENDRSGGKQDHFPLVDETERNYSDTDRKIERPKLLDPLVAGDVKLLVFLPDGTPIPDWVVPKDSVQYERVITSIRLYHLDHTNVVEDRRDLFNRIHQKVIDGDYHYAKYLSGEEASWYSYNRVVEELMSMVDKSAEYSRFANITIKSLAEKHPWLEALV